MAEIAHVVVLILENRSFDHLLGYLPHPDPAFGGLRGAGDCSNPGWAGGPRVPASPTAKPVLPVGPDHSHDAVMEQLALDSAGQPTCQGYVRSYERKGRGLAPPVFGGLAGPLVNWLLSRRARAVAPVSGSGPLAMACQPPGQVPVLARLALEFAVCTGWFCSVPGETWPNRNFAHAATSDGETAIQIRPYTNKTIFEVLEEHGADWRIYHDDTPQVWAFPALWDTPERHAKWFPLGDFPRHAAAGDLPAYTFIEPNHRPPLHTLDHDPVIGSPDVSNSQHPENNLVSNAAYDMFRLSGDCDFTRAERLIATVYEALRASPDLFASTLFLVTYDEHGGLYDHVPPPTGVPSPGGPASGIRRLQRMLFYRRARAFGFTMLGPRVPAVVISPLVPAGTVDTRTYDHASIPATLRSLFAPSAPPLTRRDAWAATFSHLLSLPAARTGLPDLSAHAGDLPVAVSQPAPPRQAAPAPSQQAAPAPP
ncbi:MAG: alkaline phosphatase family protein, partial [Actinobacteria bacterium]|nr:alkaline phosphatase family protein [Actinomycetota bacterium]